MGYRGLTGEQRFFLAFAHLRRGRQRRQALRNDVVSDPHPPDACRVDEKEGLGYQTLINAALRRAASPETGPLTAEALRLVLREELQAARYSV